MKRSLIIGLVLCVLSWGTEGADFKPSIAVSPDYHGEGTELIISWFPLSGKSYNIEAAARLTGP